MDHLLSLFVMLLYTAGTESIRTLKSVTVREGGTIILPCLYDSHYKLNPKYWCTGRIWNLCTVTAHTNKTKKWLITDDPAQNIFTVQLSNLTILDSGYHWCAVQIPNKLHHRQHLSLTVQPAPDLSVVKSRVTGQEGDQISVKCLYSSAYKNKEKKWCRLEDPQCYSEGKFGTMRNSVQITDDGRESFTVVMTGLTQNDSGWYYCSAGDMQVPVQLFVKWSNTSKKTSENGKHLENDVSPFTNSVWENHQIKRHETEDIKHSSSENRIGVFLVLLISGSVLLVLILVLVICWIKRKHNVLLTPGPDNSTVAEGSVSVWYATVVFKKAKDIQEDGHVSIQYCPDEDDAVVYSTVKRLQ